VLIRAARNNIGLLVRAGCFLEAHQVSQKRVGDKTGEAIVVCLLDSGQESDELLADLGVGALVGHAEDLVLKAFLMCHSRDNYLFHDKYSVCQTISSAFSNVVERLSNRRRNRPRSKISSTHTQTFNNNSYICKHNNPYIMNIIPESWLYLYALLSESVEKDYLAYRSKKSWREDEKDFFKKLDQGIDCIEFDDVPASQWFYIDDLRSVYQTVWDSSFNRVEVIPDDFFSCEEKLESLVVMKQFAQRLQERLFALHGRPYFLMNDGQRNKLISECSSIIRIVDWVLSYESLNTLDIEELFCSAHFNDKELHRLFCMLSCNDKEAFSVEINDKCRNSIRDSYLSNVLEQVFRSMVNHPMVDQKEIVFIPGEQTTLSEDNLWITSYDEDKEQYSFGYPLSMEKCRIYPVPSCAMSIYTFLVALVSVMEPDPIDDDPRNPTVFSKWRKHWYQQFLNRIEWEEIRRADNEDWMNLYRVEAQNDYKETGEQIENSYSFLRKRKNFNSKIIESIIQRSSTTEVLSRVFIESYISNGCPKEDYRTLISRVDNDEKGISTRLDILKTTLFDLISDIRFITADRRYIESRFVSSAIAEDFHNKAVQSDVRIREAQSDIYKYCFEGDGGSDIWNSLLFWTNNSKYQVLVGRPPISKDTISRMIDDIIYFETEVKNYLRESISDEVFVSTISKSPLTYRKEDDPIMGGKRLPLHELERMNIVRRDGSRIILQKRKRSDLSRVLAENDFVDFEFGRYIKWKFDRNSFCELKQDELADLRETARWDRCENLFYNPEDLENAIPASAIKKSFTERMDSLGVIQNLWKILWDKNKQSLEANQGR